MTDRDSLGDRMKTYERVTQTALPRRTYTIIRADGRAFHTYLRGAAKPYDFEFMAVMDHVALRLCEEVSGVAFAYTQSDEISLLLTDFASPGTQPWFGGNVQKMVSTVAALASVTLSSLRPEAPPATFDARVFTIPDALEVTSYFIWRQQDAVRNSIAMAAQAQFSPKQLHGVNTGQMQEMLWSQKGINFNAYPEGAKRGRVVLKESGERETTFTHKRSGVEETVTTVRTWWIAQPAPHFTTSVLLGDFVPERPSLPTAIAA